MSPLVLSLRRSRAFAIAVSDVPRSSLRTPYKPHKKQQTILVAERLDAKNEAKTHEFRKWIPVRGQYNSPKQISMGESATIRLDTSSMMIKVDRSGWGMSFSTNAFRHYRILPQMCKQFHCVFVFDQNDSLLIRFLILGICCASKIFSNISIFTPDRRSPLGHRYIQIMYSSLILSNLKMNLYTWIPEGSLHHS